MMAKVKANSLSNNDTLTGNAISAVSTDTRNHILQARANSSIARVTSVERTDTRELTVLLKWWSQLKSNLWIGDRELRYQLDYGRCDYGGLKISKPILSAGKMVRSGRKIVLNEHNSYIEDKQFENESLWN